MREQTYSFRAQIALIGINPYVLVPEDILIKIFQDAGRDKSPIPIHGTINGKPYTQTLVRYQGAWRLYINTAMLENSPKRVADWIDLSLSFDPADRTLNPHPKLVHALNRNVVAKEAFEQLAPYLQKEIIRYIALIKTEQKVEENVDKAIRFLLGKGRFIGRDPK